MNHVEVNDFESRFVFSFDSWASFGLTSLGFSFRLAVCQRTPPLRLVAECAMCFVFNGLMCSDNF